MKTTIRFFEQFALDLKVERADDGTHSIQALFSEFLGRPSKPHLSFFGQLRQGWSLLTPHFTAGGGAFRRTLIKIAPKKLVAGLERSGTIAARKFANSLRRTTLEALDAQNWTAHGADPHVLFRWVRIASRSPEFRVDEKMIEALALHVIRNRHRPTSLHHFPSHEHYRFVALRRDERGDFEGRLLLYFPDGYWLENAAGEPECVHKAGWYTVDSSWMDDETMNAMLPVARLRKLGNVVSSLLRRYPRREDWPRFKGGLDPIGSQILGVYGGDLLQMAVATSISRREAIPSP